MNSDVDPAPTPTVWNALDAWGQRLPTWQRQILVLSTQGGPLADDQIDGVYDRFLGETGLADPANLVALPATISGRPAEAPTAPVSVNRVDCLSGINALPDGASLTFGKSLTVIYGRNGAGKSGFARIFANACFSRHTPQILGNIYADAPPTSISARFHLGVGGQAQAPFLFAPGDEHAELKRISVFDMTVAHMRVSQSTPFEFKPAGFDVFPEMVRVFGAIGVRLDAAVALRTRNIDFSKSFIGDETSVSKLVASIGVSTDLTPIRALATYGTSEQARLAELDAQLAALRRQSPKDLIAGLKQARSDIDALKVRLTNVGAAFTPENAIRRAALASQAAEMSRTAASLGSDTFKRPFFRAVGTPQWDDFAKAAHALARHEGEAYPNDSDRCLLCARVFDEGAKAHVQALLAFVESDAQRHAEIALGALQQEIDSLRNIDLNVFGEESRVRGHLGRLDPTLETSVSTLVGSLGAVRDEAVRALDVRNEFDGSVDVGLVNVGLDELRTRIDTDVTRLETEDPSAAIASLELERQTLRHREVLSQLLPSIEVQVADTAWCAKAARAKSALTPRPVTDKEKELFGQIIGQVYRTRLTEECQKLDCALPVELQTAGQRGQTVRSLAMRGGHRPDTILSEGEQKAIALADFLTEVGLNTASAGIVLDDPVT